VPAPRQDQSAQRLLIGLIRGAEGNPAEALAAVAEDRYAPYAAYRHSIRADAFAQLGQYDSAAVAVRTLSDEFHFGYDGQDEWLRGWLRLGRAAEAAGDSGEARRAFSAYVNRWQAGDPTLPELVWARRELLRLQTAAPR
jgi:hypothetical protein